MKKFLKEKIGTIIFLILAILVVFIGYHSINKAKENAITYNTDYEAAESNIPEGDGEFVSIAKSDKLELFYNDVTSLIQVKDLESGYVWNGYCDNDEYPGMSKLSKKWKAYLQSTIAITYNDLKKRDAAPQKVYASTDAKWRSSELIENGVSITYGFTKPGIYITVEITLEEGELVVRVPHEKIEEYSRYAITSMEVLPFLGASNNDHDGYIFYPDGSGAVTTFAKAPTRPENAKMATYYTYSSKYLDYTNYADDDQYDRYTASMPVYGVKRDDNAVFAAITEGEAASGVLVYPSGCNNVFVNHIGFQIDLRNVFNVDNYSMSTGADTRATGGVIQRVDKNFITETRELRYFFLSGDDANYSGMANLYRDFLIEKGRLNDVIKDGDEMPLALEILCGAEKDGMVFRQYIPMTSSQQVVEILDELKNQGITTVNTVLDAWQSDANYSNNYWPAALKIGGKSGLNDVSDYVEDNNAVNVFLSQDTTFVYDLTKKLNKTNDVVYNGLDVEVSMEMFNGDICYLLNAQSAQNRNNDLLSKLHTAKNLGIAYSSLGYYIYADHNENAPFTKQEMTEKQVEMLNDTRNDGRKVAVAGSNQYIFQASDYIYNLKEDAYGLAITDYSVPFTEMILSGCVPYSTNGAGNLSYDLDYQKLKWIEYGATPYFFLTAESALNLRETNYDTLFSSTFTDWEDELVSIYSEFKANLGEVYGKQMVAHDYLTDDVVRIKYENGWTIYINYGENSLPVDGYMIPAKDYAIVRGGE